MNLRERYSSVNDQLVQDGLAKLKLKELAQLLGTEPSTLSSYFRLEQQDSDNEQKLREALPGITAARKASKMALESK
ncbi:MAG: hypothetical protein DRQ46_00560 [Gammaproteobacteria bacterium]|nr:MAG: hypothetical protein DRQ46_00560 [Gammaproteobacteria bacterium]